MADAALVGMPSAGKSLAHREDERGAPEDRRLPVHHARAEPGRGALGRLTASSWPTSPGLIEGAHEGRGLGHEFLRHIERTALIVHVVDLTGDYEGRDPLEDYDIINRELALYADELAARPRIVVANKIDVPGTEEAGRPAGGARARGLHRGRGRRRVRPEPRRPEALPHQRAHRRRASTASRPPSPTKVHELREARARPPGRRRAVRPRVGAQARGARQAASRCATLGGGVFRVDGPRRSSAWWCRPTGRTRRPSPSCSTASSASAWRRRSSSAGAVDGDEIRIVGRAFDFESARTAEDMFKELDL